MTAHRRLFFRNTATEPTTNGSTIYDLSETQGSPAADLQVRFNTEVFTPIAQFLMQIDEEIVSTSFPLSVSVSSVVGVLEYRFRVQRRGSSGNIIANSDYSAVHTTAGVKTDELTLSSAWAVGDLVTVSVEGRRTGGHGNVDVFISTQNANSFLDVEFFEAMPVNRVRYFDGADWVEKPAKTFDGTWEIDYNIKSHDGSIWFPWQEP